MSATNKHWETKAYYSKASAASRNAHPGMSLLYNLSGKANIIVDLGCGEGTRLGLIKAIHEDKKLVGIDISKKAIALAKEKYKGIKFVKGDLEKIPLKNNYSDLVFSAFVLEHTDDSEKVIKEAVRITKRGGNILLIAPNYGAPNRSSPPYSGSRLKKLLFGLASDFNFVKQKGSLRWNKVTPLKGKYEIDSDTTVEPYLRTLVVYLNYLGAKVVYENSCWGEELPNAKFHQKIFRAVGELGIYPFKYWGPHLVVHAIKK